MPLKERKATQSVIKFQAVHFGTPQSQVRLLSGFRSKRKVIELEEE
jgi:uncharacterized protein YggU (UPF0235/DUF167 family)